MSDLSNVFLPGFGGQLKAGREAKGLSAVDVASKLKLTARQIEALEAEDFQHLPGEVFVRGFVRNYARLVGMDPEQLLSHVDAIATVSETITAPSEGLTFKRPGVRRWVVLPLIVGALFVGLVALIYNWLREGEAVLVEQPVQVQAVPLTVTPAPSAPADGAPGGAAQTEAAPASAETNAATASTPAPAATPPAPAATPPAPAVAAPAPAAPVAQGGAAPAKPVTPSPAAAAKPVPVAPPPPPAPAPAAKPKEPPAASKPASAEGLRFAASADAWIQVVDAKGKRFSKLVKAGSAETFAGEAPFKLVVGEARQVKLTYNGHSVDLVPFIGEKVARLTLE